MSDEQLQTILQFFKVLADESRLRLVGVLANGERGVDDLAATLGLTAPTISHHLSRLRAAGLVQMRREGTSHLYRLDTEALRALSKDVLEPARLAEVAVAPAGEAWERKVLRDFFTGETLREIPAARKKRYVVLRWLADRFDPERRYAEREVNDILSRHHPDVATLRRELVSDLYSLMRREDGVYWRLPSSEQPATLPRY